jgi:hypothetical protein
VLVHDGAGVAIWNLRREGRPDLALVDELARLQLAAKRLGCVIRLRNPDPALSRLLDLVGLAEVIAEIGEEVRATDLVVEVDREAEGGEQVGVEKRVEPGDLPT